MEHHRENRDSNMAQSARSADQRDGDQNKQTIPKEIESKLQSAGYKEVRIVPGSYVVSANDRNGNPTIMLIGPYSFESVTLYNTSSDADRFEEGDEERDPPSAKTTKSERDKATQT